MKAKNYQKFVSCDQLNHQMETNEILYGFREGNISLFAPTYRWQRDCNKISNKREQSPSYTDRILYKSLPHCYSFWQTKYKPKMTCFGSDHRPIISIFKFVTSQLPTHKSKQFKYGQIEIGFYEIKLFFDSSKECLEKS